MTRYCRDIVMAVLYGAALVLGVIIGDIACRLVGLP